MSKSYKYDSDVIRLHGMGWSQNRIAKELGTSQQYISSIMLRLGLRTDTEHSDRDERIAELYQSGLTMEDVAQTIDVHKSTVMSALRRMKIERRPHGPSKSLSETEIEAVLRQYREGVSTSLIAKQFNCTERTVQRICKRHGVQRNKPKAKQ